MPSAMWTVPARRARGARHGIGPVEGPVDLERPVVVLEAVELAPEGRRQLGGIEQASVQLRRADVGDHRAGCGVPGSGTAHGAGAAAGDLDRRRPLAAHDLAAACPQPGEQRIGDPPRPAVRHRKAVILSQRAQDPPEHPAQRGLGADVGVQRVPGQQPRPRVGGKPFLAEPANRKQREPGKAQQLARAELTQQRHDRHDRRERVEERPQRARSNAPPERIELPPGIAVPRGAIIQGGGRLLDIQADRRAGAVLCRVGNCDRRGDPAHTPPLELQRLHVWRGERERIERAEHVVHVAGLDQLTRAYGAAGLRGLLEHRDRPAGVGEHVRRDEPVGPGADDDGVGHRRSGRGGNSPSGGGSRPSARSRSRRSDLTLRSHSSR